MQAVTGEGNLAIFTIFKLLPLGSSIFFFYYSLLNAKGYLSSKHLWKSRWNAK